MAGISAVCLEARRLSRARLAIVKADAISCWELLSALAYIELDGELEVTNRILSPTIIDLATFLYHYQQPQPESEPSYRPLTASRLNTIKRTEVDHRTDSRFCSSRLCETRWWGRSRPRPFRSKKVRTSLLSHGTRFADRRCRP